MPRIEQLTPSSRVLHRIDYYTSVPTAALILAVVLAVALIVGAVLGFPGGGMSGFELMMVAVIQHPQGREQTATQRKLDELLRAMPHAQTGLIMLEEESDETIQEVEESQRRSKQA